MFLVTGGTGFIGGHLLEKLPRAESVAVPLRSTLVAIRGRPLFPRAWKRRRSIGPPAQGIEAALEGVDAVIHLAGVTKALAAADYYERKHPRHRNAGPPAGRPANPPGACQLAGRHGTQPGWRAAD